MNEQLLFPFWEEVKPIDGWEHLLPVTLGTSRRKCKVSDRGWKTSTGYIYLRCPFHSDKTASLRLDKFPGTVWYCFGCCRLGHIQELIQNL